MNEEALRGFAQGGGERSEAIDAQRKVYSDPRSPCDVDMQVDPELLRLHRAHAASA